MNTIFLNFQGHSTFGLRLVNLVIIFPNTVGYSFYGYQTLCRVTKIGILILMSQILAFDSVLFSYPLLSLGCCCAWRLVSYQVPMVTGMEIWKKKEIGSTKAWLIWIWTKKRRFHVVHLCCRNQKFNFRKLHFNL